MGVEKTLWRFLCCAIGCVLCLSRAALAEEAHCPRPVAEIVSVQGQMEMRAGPDTTWRSLALHSPICPGDTIRVGALSRGAVFFVEAETVLRLDENTTTTIQALAAPGQSLLDLLEGAVYFFSRVPRALEVRTPYVTAGIEGTEFFIRVDTATGSTFITVFEGTVTASNDRGNLRLKRGQSAEAMAGRAPEVRVVVRPREAVQWTLHYQPVLAALAAPRAARDETALLREVQAALAEGGAAAALRRLDELPDAERDSTTALWRAALLMRVGRWSRAREILDGLVRQAPENAVAHAILAVIHVTQNRTADALEAGREAVRLDPESSPARIALSYARQADFDLRILAADIR